MAIDTASRMSADCGPSRLLEPDQADHLAGTFGRQRTKDAGATRHPMFAGPSAATFPLRRGRGLLVAVLVHGLLVLPLVVSVTHYDTRPAQVLEPMGVTFVPASLRGIGSPPPSEKSEPKRSESSKPPKPVVSEPPTEVPLLTAESLAPLIPTLTLDLPPTGGLAISATGEATDGTRTTGAESAASPGNGPGGHGDGFLPPAIGTPSGQSNWAGLVLGRLEQFRRYPAPARRDRQQGVAYVRFTIDREGHVLASSLDRTSGHTLLDREAVALVRRADPLPAPPPELEGDTVTLTVPVEFLLTR